MKKVGWIAGVILGMTLLIGCNGGEGSTTDQTGTGTPAQVTVEEAKQLIDEGEVQIIDVRTSEEYAEGHIPGAVHIPLDTLETRLDELAEDQSYLLVCRSGSRSAQAQQVLEQHGITHTYNMQGGVTAWPDPLTK